MNTYQNIGHTIYEFVWIGLLFFVMPGCTKYLEEKPDKKLVVPMSVQDFQALLDNPFQINNKVPSWDEASADNYYLPTRQYNRLGMTAKSAYIWKDYDRPYIGGNDWSIIYDGIYYPNICIDGIEKIERTPYNGKNWDNVKGSALFYRSLGFLRAAFIFSKAYDASTAEYDLGIVLRLTPDFNIPSLRASVKDTYNQIIQDLNIAASLLPDLPIHAMRPSKAAAYGLLARTYLSMRQYDSSLKYADMCLKIRGQLMDYNNPLEVNPDNTLFPITRFNKEVIFSSALGTYMFESIYPGIARVDTVLYASYAENDLRKQVFYTDILGNGYIFQGTYDGSYTELFTGIATDEIFLTRAECYARKGKKEDALSDLNALIEKRWRKGFYVPFTASTSEEALSLVLSERRKELVFRGLRWMDIKRLNKEGAGITLTRTVEGQIYFLNPNDDRYALLIPIDIINSTGIPQNPR